MSPNLSLSPTPSTWNAPASTGLTPKPTLSPLYPQHGGLQRRAADVGANTCGWINGDQNQPFICESPSTCVGDAQYTAFGCCAGPDVCGFYTVCVDYNPGFCKSDCSHYEYTLGCVGDGGCVTWVMPGAVPYSLVGCSTIPGTVEVQTTYAGGPNNQQVPMPLTNYLVAASSAAAASASAAEASFNGGAGSSGDNSSAATSSWISGHKALLIGVIAGVVALLLLCCCLSCFRRKKNTRARAAPAPSMEPPPNYQNTPQQAMQGHEQYPMMQYQYGPNK